MARFLNWSRRWRPIRPAILDSIRRPRVAPSRTMPTCNRRLLRHGIPERVDEGHYAVKSYDFHERHNQHFRTGERFEDRFCFDRAAALHGTGKFAEAEALLREAIAADPT